jgi:hypothetical protein
MQTIATRIIIRFLGEFLNLKRKYKGIVITAARISALEDKRYIESSKIIPISNHETLFNIFKDLSSIDSNAMKIEKSRNIERYEGC